jgi:hypothetical protein
MKYVSPYGTTPESAQLICEYFKGNEQIFAKVVTFENVEWESRMLNIAESAISEKALIDLHFDMIVNDGARAITKYYKNLISGKNDVLERAKIKFTNLNSHRIDESADIFRQRAKKRMTNMLAELDLNTINWATNPGGALQTQLTNATGQTVPTSDLQNQLKAALTGGAKPTATGAIANTPEEFDKALAGGEYTGKTEGSTMGFLHELWSALTEGGSTIGIVHLVLDIVGVVGDIFGPAIPIGLVADVLNAIIYFVRATTAPEGESGKFWLLGSISLIAAFVFGAGDVLKLLKPAAKSAAPVMEAILKGGSKAGGDALAKVSAKEAGPVMKLLQFISKNISGVLGKASGLLGKFFDGFIAKLVGWIPFIGKPLKGFFESIGTSFAKYGDNLTGFAKEYSAAEKAAIEIGAKEIDTGVETMLKNSNQSLIIDDATKMAKIVDQDGKAITKEFQADWLKKDFDKKAAGLFGNDKAIAKYYSNVASSNAVMAEGIGKYFIKKGWKSIKGTGKLAFFIGKQIIKLINNGKDWQDLGYKKEEVEYWGNSALHSWLQDEIHKKKEETGATYLPAIDLDSDQKEVFDNITNYQNNYAKLFGQPSIIPVIYNKYGNTEDEFNEFFDEVKKGTVKPEDSDESKKESVKESISHLRYIIPYSKF